MSKILQVVDDFYADPWMVRETGLREESWLPPFNDGGHKFSTETQRLFYTPELVDLLEGLVGSKIKVDPKRVSFGVFAYYGEDSDVRFSTHFDDTDWSAIVYLVPPESCSGGVSLYQHVPTGLFGPPANDEEAAELGFESRRQFLDDVYFPDKRRPDRWREVDHIGMAFNRMVLLHGSARFHRATSGFGKDRATVRLTQRFFFDEAGDPR
ncbi:hypothetical protein [Nonomuraea sp. NPDC049158]|uniref:hypothetical protein n=1 Tax=Nonomuraea sp. NPDC049158 TaxID=3155649 RepID=UPI0033EB1C5D